MTSAAYQRAAKVAGFIDKAENLGKRRAREEKGDHRKPPPGVKLPPKPERIAFMRKRDGDFCQCGCGQRIGAQPVEEEHRIRLEAVRDLPDEQRAWYFSLENMRLFIAGHQVEKNRQEAIERAHFARVRQKTVEHKARLNSAEKDRRIQAREAAHRKALAAKAGLA